MNQSETLQSQNTISEIKKFIRNHVSRCALEKNESTNIKENQLKLSSLRHRMKNK